jgi:hypothetical protein
MYAGQAGGVMLAPAERIIQRQHSLHSAYLGFAPNDKKARRALWYPTQAKSGLEWGTQPSLLVRQVAKEMTLQKSRWMRGPEGRSPIRAPRLPLKGIGFVVLTQTPKGWGSIQRRSERHRRGTKPGSAPIWGIGGKPRNLQFLLPYPRLGAPFKPGFGLSGIPQRSTRLFFISSETDSKVRPGPGCANCRSRQSPPPHRPLALASAAECGPCLPQPAYRC